MGGKEEKRRDDGQIMFDRRWGWNYLCDSVNKYQDDRQVRRLGSLLEVLMISPWKVIMEPGSLKQSDVRLGDIQKGERQGETIDISWSKTYTL